MKSPPGWVEPGQRPEFDEYTIVLAGTLHVKAEAGEWDVRAGQAIVTRAGEWVQYSTPGAEHKALEQFVGTWDTSVKMWMAPGAQPQESTGTAENKMTLGGRFLEQHYEGTMMGQPFTGMGYTGYDLYKKDRGVSGRPRLRR